MTAVTEQCSSCGEDVTTKRGAVEGRMCASCQRAARKAKTAPSSARFVIGRLYSTHSGPDSPMKILVGRVCASAPEFWGDRTHIGPDCLLKLEGSAKVGERYPVRDDGVGPLVCVGDAS